MQPGHVPGLGIEPVTFWCLGQHSNQLSHTSQSKRFFFKNIELPYAIMEPGRQELVGQAGSED